MTRKHLNLALAWAGAVISPVLLYLAVSSGSQFGVERMFVGLPIRYLMPVLALLLPIPLLRRQQLPALFLLVLGATAATVTIHGGDLGYLSTIGQLQLVAVAGAVGYLTARRSRRLSIPVTLAVLALSIVAAFAGAPGGNGNSNLLAALLTLGLLTAWMIGNSVRSRREYGQKLQAQAAAQAATDERLRIARELHDMVAHSIGIIAIQAGMGSRVIDTRPEEARTALRTIETTSRETLAGLRRLLGGLRQSSADDDSAGGRLDLAPAPDLAAVDRLAAATSDAGIRVDVRWLGRRRPLPADLELSAFRIVQEALTNVVRHAGAESCQVTIDYGDDVLELDIVDAGRGCVAPGAGYGLAGMRERVSLLDGALEAGPRPEGGFRVTARLPVPEAAETAGVGG